MVVELTGSTSAGKSSLAKRLLERLAEQGVPAMSAEQFVCRCYGLQLGWVRWPVAISLIVDILAAPWCGRFLLRRPGLCWFVARIVWRDLDSLLFRLNVLRNIAKRLGTHELLASHGTADHVVLLDEGLVHQAHSLFVHPSLEPRPEELERFLAEMPLPDLLVLVEGPGPELAQRTARRGHQRLPGARIAEVGAFVARAQDVLRCVAALAAQRTAVVVVHNVGIGEASLEAAVDELLGSLERARPSALLVR